jgi:hypothetical protein
MNVANMIPVAKARRFEVSKLPILLVDQEQDYEVHLRRLWAA